jgi:hypothetical protein
MPSIEKHCEISRIRTGNDYLLLHKWMDADPKKKAERHDLARIYEHGKMMEKKHGTEGLQEYLQHIRDDFLARFNNVKEIMDKDLSEALSYLVTQPRAKTKFGSDR